MTLEDTTVITLVTGITTVLSGAIVVLWQKQASDTKRLNEKSDKCEADREKLYAMVAELRGDSVLLDRCPAHQCPLRREEDELPHHRSRYGPPALPGLPATS
jgi:hypothetical protein